MNELDLKYKELKEKEVEEKEKKKERYKKTAKVVLTNTLIVIGFFSLIIFIGTLPPSDALLESEYTEFFETPCIKPWEKTLAREWGEDWSNQVKQTIIGQAKREEYYRKEIYEAHRLDCERLKKSGVVRDMTKLARSSNKTRTKRGKPSIERRTSAGFAVERGADIDYRIDSDKIINLSINMIRRKGYSCNSISSIKLYKYPERIRVDCNGGGDRYTIQRDSAGLFRQVTRR